MRPITSHAINPCNEAIKVAALDGPGPGGASHRYSISFDEMHPANMAEIAYRAYAHSTGGKNFQGNPMPAWSDLPPAIQKAWCASVAAVLEKAATCPDLAFQNGPVNENGEGVNGITNEALLAVLIDRLEGFERGPYANPFNGTALNHLREAGKALQDRTRNRMERGVEGTHQV